MSFNPTTQEDQLEANVPKTVTWPSLFWGLLAFATNSMAQPAGAVCGADADVNFELRSSPIICASDAFLILWRFLYYLIFPPKYQRKDSWRMRVRTAHIRLLRFRFQDELKEPSRKGDFADLLRNRYVRLGVFLVALSQMVKLYGYVGIPWTQAFASMYLVSFFIIEILVAWHGSNADQWLRSSEPEKMIQSSGPTSLAYTSIATSVAFTLYFATVAARDMLGRPADSLLRWGGLVIPVCGAVFCIPVYVYSVINRDRFQQIVIPGLLLIILICFPLLPYIMAPLIERGALEKDWHEVITTLLVVLWTSIGLKFTSAATSIVRVSGHDNARKRMEKGAVLYFLIFNLVAAALFYKFSYDPTNTQKLWWTDYLG